MSNYTITTDFGAKDSLPSSNDSKVVRGSEFTTEFTNIQTAIATKADTAGDTFTGVVNFSADVAVNTNTLFVDVSEAKVGIGTTNPSHTFDVYANADNKYVAQFSQDHATGWGVLIDTDGTANNDSALWIKNSSDTIMWAAQSGNVGIGTASPDSLMHLSANTGATLTLESTDTAIAVNEVIGEIDFYSNDASGIGAASRGSISLIAQDAAGAGSMLFKTSNASTASTEAMRIDSSGNVLVGTTDTDRVADTGITLTPSGFIDISRSGTIAGRFARQGSNGSVIDFRREGTNIVGSISVTTSATAYNTSSDERLKENIADSADAGSKVDAIQIRQFDWKADGSHQDYGVIAQELATVAPEAVHQPEDSEEMMGVDYSKLVPMLIKEVQSLRSRVAELENA